MGLSTLRAARPPTGAPDAWIRLVHQLCGKQPGSAPLGGNPSTLMVPSKNTPQTAQTLVAFITLVHLRSSRDR